MSGSHTSDAGSFPECAASRAPGDECRDASATESRSSTPPLFDEAVLSRLTETLLAGNCVAFVGAGFSAAAKLPKWGELLLKIAGESELSTQETREIGALVERGSAHAYERAAQMLRDKVGKPRFLELLRGHMVPTSNPIMEKRLWLMKRIPFRLILTTNFDGLLKGAVPGRKEYREALRGDARRWWSAAYVDERHEEGAKVLKLHGDLSATADDGQIVLSSVDYRRRLYNEPSYVMFLRSLLATTTVLYLGFSFEDAYLNELRSEVLATMDDPGLNAQPLAYALMADVPPLTVQHYREHEGVQILPYTTRGQDDHRAFDACLEALYQATHPRCIIGRFLNGRRILWIDPQPDNNGLAFSFLQSAGVTIVTSPSVADGLQRMERAQTNGKRFDLVITHWGYNTPTPAGPGTACYLLREMRVRNLQAPVIVFSSPERAKALTAEALSRGALAYHSGYEGLFQEIQRLFARVSSDA
jgi:hypothetical protein